MIFLEHVCVLSNAFESDTATMFVIKFVCRIMCNVYVCMYVCIIICMYVYMYINTGEGSHHKCFGQSTCLGSSNLLTIECVLLSELSFDKTTHT